jgi:hypothetical protein
MGFRIGTIGHHLSNRFNSVDFRLPRSLALTRLRNRDGWLRHNSGTRRRAEAGHRGMGDGTGVALNAGLGAQRHPPRDQLGAI